MRSKKEELHDLRRILRRGILSAGDLEEALGAGLIYGALNWRNNDGFLEDDSLEVFLHDRHGAALRRHQNVFSGLDGLDSETNWLHVITEAYDLGGHTRLLENLLKIQSQRDATLAVAVTRRTTPRFEDLCKTLGVSHHCLSGDQSSRAAAIYALGRSAERIMLHIHPDDLGAALAARALRADGRPVFFLNHADHVFSFGPGAADAVLEVSGFGWSTTARRRVAKAQHFLGIPVSAQPPKLISAPVPNGPILSIGSGHKYRPSGSVSFPEFLSSLLERTDHDIELIGPRGTESWWQDVADAFPGRIRFHGPLPFEETAARLAKACCYIDSFPMTGGTTFSQALMAGKTVFGSSVQVAGYSLADSLRSSSLDAMLDAVTSFLRTGVEPPDQSSVRRRIAEEFGPEAIHDRLTRILTGEGTVPPADFLQVDQDLDYFVKDWENYRPVYVELLSSASVSPLSRIALVIRVLRASHVVRPRLIHSIKWVLRSPRWRGFSCANRA